jgi:hypothetical protein
MFNNKFGLKLTSVTIVLQGDDSSKFDTLNTIVDLQAS